MKVLIAGAGIAGLATAVALRRAGHQVQVLERRRELTEIGAALAIWPNGTRALEALGVEAACLNVERHSFRTWQGRELMELPMDALVERYGSGMTLVHRADLQSALRAALDRESVHLGCEVTGFTEEEGGVQVTMRDGRAAQGDVLIGADGLRSAVRRRLLGDGEPTYLGCTAWRGVVAPGVPTMESRHGLSWGGRGAEFLAFPLADGRVYWAGVCNAPEGGRPGLGGHRQDLIERFGSWQQPIPKLLEATPEEAILRNDVYDRPPSRRWSSGRVTLVGDAAHPMTPEQAQGACQGLEDAVALGDCLGESDSAKALAEYDRRRLAQANRVVARSRHYTRAMQLENPVLCMLRDTAARLLPRALLLQMLDATFAARQ